MRLRKSDVEEPEVEEMADEQSADEEPDSDDLRKKKSRGDEVDIDSLIDDVEEPAIDEDGRTCRIETEEEEVVEEEHTTETSRTLSRI